MGINEHRLRGCKETHPSESYLLSHSVTPVSFFVVLSRSDSIRVRMYCDCGIGGIKRPLTRWTDDDVRLGENTPSFSYCSS